MGTLPRRSLMSKNTISRGNLFQWRGGFWRGEGMAEARSNEDYDVLDMKVG